MNDVLWPVALIVGDNEPGESVFLPACESMQAGVDIPPLYGATLAGDASTCQTEPRKEAAMILTISEADVAKVLKYEQLIQVIENSLTDFSAGRVIQPVRNMLTIEEGQRFLGVMPAVTPGGMGAKLVSFYPKNAGSDVPTHLAMILLFEPETGQPLACIDGRLITEMRTAAASAAVTKYASPEGSKVLALLGSGVQAQAHLEALRHVCEFTEVRVWSRTPDRALHFADTHGVKAMDLEAAVQGADVIVTATNALEPFLKGEWLKEGAHVNAVGSPRPTWRELDDDVMCNTLIVDSREAVLKEAGDVILSNATIFAEAGEVFAGLKPLNRSTTTVFKSVGIGVEDIATARLVYDAMVAN